MARKTIEEIIAAEVKKATDQRAEWEVADESVESILESERGTKRGLLDILKQANKKSKSKERDSLIANIRQNIDAEGVHLKKLEAALKDNESFKKRLSKGVAKSRTLAAQAEAAPDALSQGTAKLSVKAHSVKVGAPHLDNIIQGYAQRMSDVVTGMRALGLPAKKFAAESLKILNKIKKEIEVEPGFTDKDDRLAQRAKKICLIFLKQHTSNITKAVALSPGPIRNLIRSRVGRAKQRFADRIKRFPGMGMMDRLAEDMKITKPSERLTPKGWDQEGEAGREAERGGSPKSVGAVDAEAAVENLEAQTGWGSANADTAERMRAQRGGSADLVDVLQRLVDRLDESDTDPDKGRVGDDTSESPRKVKESKKEKRERRRAKRKERKKGKILGKILRDPDTGSADMATAAPAGMGGQHGDAISALNDIIGILKTGINSLGLVPDILENARHATWLLVELAREDKERDIAWARERAEARQDAAEPAPSSDTAPIPALDKLSDSPVPAGAGAGAGGGGGKGRGKGGGIGGVIGNFIGGVGGGVIAGFMKAVGGAAASSVQFVIAMTAFGVGLGAFFVALAGAAKIIQMFGGGEAIESLLTNAAAGLTAFNTIDGLNLLAVGAGMVALGLGLSAITVGSIITGLGGLLTLGDPLGDTARSLQAYNDLDGKNLLAVGEGMVALSRGMRSLTNSSMITGFKNFISGAVGTIAGWFGAEEAEKEPGILGFVKQFEAIDAEKLDKASQAIMKLAAALDALSAAGRKDNIGRGAPSPPSDGGGRRQPSEIRRRGRPPVPPPAPAEFDAAPLAPVPVPAPGSDAYAGLTIKGSSGRTQTGGGGQATDGGPVEPGVIDFASMIQGNVQGFTRFTGFNDNYHHNVSYTSKHKEGLAMDFTVAGGAREAPKAAATVRKLAADAGVSSGSMKIIDEYNDPSSEATAGHIHVGFNTKEAALAVAAGGLDTSPTFVPRAAPSRGAGGGGGGTGSLNVAAQSPGAPGASRNGTALGAATAMQASQTAAAPMIVANIGGPPAPAAPSVTTMMPIPIPVNAQNPDQVLRALHSVNYPV